MNNIVLCVVAGGGDRLNLLEMHSCAKIIIASLMLIEAAWLA